MDEVSLAPAWMQQNRTNSIKKYMAWTPECGVGTGVACGRRQPPLG